MEWADVIAATSNVTDIVGKALNVMTGNPALMTIFTAGLLTVGFRVFRKAKRAAR